jgi:hypothetical protein
VKPRPLTNREHDVLTFLLSIDFLGAEELRIQAATAQVVGDWGDCCASIKLGVDRSKAPLADVRERVPVAARSKAGAPPYELLLHVRDGLPQHP